MYRVKPRSSTALAVISIIHKWTQATDGTGSAVNLILFDNVKAFDLIDPTFLADKISNLAILPAVSRWTINFLMKQKQGEIIQCLFLGMRRCIFRYSSGYKIYLGLGYLV